MNDQTNSSADSPRSIYDEYDVDWNDPDFLNVSRSDLEVEDNFSPEREPSTRVRDLVERFNQAAEDSPTNLPSRNDDGGRFAPTNLPSRNVHFSALPYRKNETYIEKRTLFDIQATGSNFDVDGASIDSPWHFGFLHKTISKSDSLYFSPGAIQARIDEWNKLLEFNCFEEERPLPREPQFTLESIPNTSLLP